MKTLLNKKILENIPRILSLLDKNPYSSTFGSFDRKYWHYKIIDFPSGMQQELILPLAYVWKTDFEGNRYYRLSRIRDYLAGIFLYHSKNCHSDGSLDDYFPYERAFGATAYALAALTESALLTNLCPDSAIKSFEKSGNFLASYREAGRLSNHLAIAATALINLYLLTGKSAYRDSSDRVVNELFKRQNIEGWFIEYEGCDLGYQTVTIEFLAKRYIKEKSDLLFQMLKKNIAFLKYFVHPDGSLGGEYGSRNTYNFYPGGFAILSSKFIEAGQILSCFLKGLNTGACNYLEDDGVFGHMLSSYVTLLLCPTVKICEPAAQSGDLPFIKYFKEAGLFIGFCERFKIYGSTTKGGVYKVFEKNRLVYSDTGFIGQLADGTKFCQNKPMISQGVIRDNFIEIKGFFHKFTSKRLNKFQNIGLRLLSIIFGRIRSYSNVVRFLLQKALIYEKGQIPIGFTRKIILTDTGIKIEDEILIKGKPGIVSLHRSTDCVSLHVITSDSFQASNLLEWENIENISRTPILRFEKNFRL